jgi:hypothetical protein
VCNWISICNWIDIFRTLNSSSLSFCSFRFLCRALSTFLSAQLPTNGLPRVKANAPGCPKAAAKKVNLEMLPLFDLYVVYIELSNRI